jgi:hypothetical protein
MNTFRLKTLSTFLPLFFSLIILSCDIKNPVEGLEVRLNAIKRETLVTAYIYDAKTGEAIEQEVKVEFIGNNASQVVDETNDPKLSFTAKGGLFNFGIKDGAVISQSNPLKIMVKVKSSGYLEVEQTLTFASKGIKAVTLFLPKEEDFRENVSNNTLPGGSADNSGTVTDAVNISSNNGTSAVIPAGTNLTTDNGTPLTGQLTIVVKSIFYNDQTSALIPDNLQVNPGSSIVPFLNFSAVIQDGNQNVTGDLSENVKFFIPLPIDAVNPVTKNPYQPGDVISAWKLNSAGEYVQIFPRAIVSEISASIFGVMKTSTSNSLGLQISGNPNFIGDAVESCDFTFNITNPRSGFNLQLFKNNTLVESFAGIPSSITVSRNSSDPVDNYDFKFGANPVTGEGGTSYTNYISSTGCGSGSADVTFTYPAESIQASITITGVCDYGSDNPKRVYPSITFNYKKKGTTVWQQGTLDQGHTVIAGLEPNTTYEAKATYRDKEASVDIYVTNATTFDVMAGDDQGYLLRAEIVGTSSLNGETIMEIEIDIDLQDECD